MKINTQFRLLILGIVLIPILTISAQGILWLMQQHTIESISVPSYEEIAPLFDNEIERDEWEEIIRRIPHSQPEMNIMILLKDLTVIYSTAYGLEPGDTLTPNELVTLLDVGNDQYGYFIEAPGWLRDVGAFFLIRIDRSIARPPSPIVIVIKTLFVVLIVLFLFSVAMSFIIARSITKSVMVLENATRRIAAGELDLAVDVKGSNEITSLTTSLNQMRLALKEEETRRARFIMGVTHDLKTPLALIKGYAEAIGDGVADDPASRAHSVEIIATKVDQLEGMIDDLIDFVRVDTGEWRRNLDHVHIAAFLTSYTKRIADDADLLNRRVETAIDIPGNVVIPMDERLALRAIENLVNNAIRYTKPGGLITIKGYLKNNAVVIDVCDDGPGIDAEDISRIFDAFYRGSSSRREQGMGFGLTVVKGVAESHGWEISVESEKGKGSCFRLTLPYEPDPSRRMNPRTSGHDDTRKGAGY
ncbi:ATP-binding protein [Breznakiella homolactica]|uniref:histidine kinase n=1 Tax=Breznakiella homolactica TaxID=2798577 RepID=A0A7T8B9R4_9SPIR|nr:ATP-binding protein [Breznakiella homolactica]QQO07458.1 HAMP domain-containing protein [Breznakiella homolactica]